MLRTITLTSSALGSGIDGLGRARSRRVASALEHREDCPFSGFDASHTVDLAVFRRTRIAATCPLEVIVDKRFGLRVVDGEALLNRLFLVVVALDQGLARDVVAVGNLRRVEFDVIGPSRGDVHAPTAHALDDRGIWDVDLEYIVDGYSRILQGVRMRQGARKAVEQVAPGAIRLFQPFFDLADDDVVGYERAGIHHLFRGHAKRRPSLDRSAQHVARRDLWNTVRLPNIVGLRSFAGAGRAEQYQSHDRGQEV